MGARPSMVGAAAALILFVLGASDSPPPTHRLQDLADHPRDEFRYRPHGVPVTEVGKQRRELSPEQLSALTGLRAAVKVAEIGKEARFTIWEIRGSDIGDEAK